MPMRNGQNPTRAAKSFDHNLAKGDNSQGAAANKSGCGMCPSCGAEVPPKPGFRLSSLKCPKCGSPMSKK